MGFKEAIRTCVKEKYITFSGRAPRSEFWYFMLFFMLVTLIPFLIGLYFFSTGNGELNTPSVVFFVIGALIYLALFIPMISVYVRRFHDRNLSGWWVLVVFLGSAIPYLGVVISLVSFVITVLKGTEGENKFGPDPLQEQDQADVFA